MLTHYFEAIQNVKELPVRFEKPFRRLPVAQGAQQVSEAASRLQATFLGISDEKPGGRNPLRWSRFLG